MKCRKDLQLCFGSKDLNELWFSLQPPLTCGRSSLVSTLRYLQEVGYTDTILDVKSQRVRALLGLTGDSGDKPSEKKPEPMVNGTEPSSLKDSGMVRYDLFVLCFSSCFLLAVSGWWRLFGSEHQSHTITQTDLLVLAALDQQPCVLQAKMTVFVYGVSTHLFSSLSASSKPDMSDSATVLEAFKFIESAAAEFSDEDEEEDSEGRDKTILDLAAVRL